MTTRRSAERRATADADREEKLRALHDQLAQQVAALRSGDDWQRWLAAAARFHNYSTGREGYSNLANSSSTRPRWQALGVAPG